MPELPAGRPRFHLVIFDNDGVLVDSEPMANGVLARLLTEYGLPMTVDTCMKEFMGSSLGRVRRMVEARGVALPDDFEPRYENQLFREFEGSLRPVQGVEAVLGALADAGVEVCVASSGSRKRIRVALEAAGLAHWFGGRVVSAQDVAQAKPAPDLFLRAAALAGVAPYACVVIEDSPVGIDAAAAAGMTAIGYAGRTAATRLAAASGGVVTVMAALPALIWGPARLGPKSPGSVEPWG